MNDMQDVTESIFRRCLAWIKEANNYIGSPKHQVDGHSYYIRVDGINLLAAEEIADDFTDRTIYRIRKTTLARWRAEHGHTAP